MHFASKQCPSYKKLQAAKIDCYPRDITITEKDAEVKLQALLDHTVLRIISSIIATDLQKTDCEDFVLYGKWGMDGASTQQNFKQKWSINNDKDATDLSDSTVFVISYIPLILTSDNNILWRNDRPSSVRHIVDLSNLNFLKRHHQMFCVNIIFM